MNSVLRALAPLSLVLIAACSSGDGAAEAPPLAGASIGGPFTLTAEDGRTVTDRSFAGQYRIVYFGYTFCPDVCPVDMQRLAAGLKALEARDPALAARIQPIFVTIDPARDTPEVLRTFTDAFHPRLIGLTGTPEQIRQVADAYAIFYSRGPGTSPTDYLMNHSNQAYLMSPEGEPIALVAHDGTPDEIADELRRWVK